MPDINEIHRRLDELLGMNPQSISEYNSVAQEQAVLRTQLRNLEGLSMFIEYQHLTEPLAVKKEKRGMRTEKIITKFVQDDQETLEKELGETKNKYLAIVENNGLKLVSPMGLLIATRKEPDTVVNYVSIMNWPTTKAIFARSDVYYSKVTPEYSSNYSYLFRNPAGNSVRGLAHLAGGYNTATGVSMSRSIDPQMLNHFQNIPRASMPQEPTEEQSPMYWEPSEPTEEDAEIEVESEVVF